MNRGQRAFTKKRRGGMKAWKPAIALMILTPLLASCRSLPEGTSAISRPTVPDPIVNGQSIVTFDRETEKVCMPLWYWKKVVRYITGAEAAFDLMDSE
ncbi:MAG: hypothetical protein ACTTKL_07575 [Treponema sp.]